MRSPIRHRPCPPCGIVALLTDFGRADWYVAAMKGILLSRCPAAQLVDITHDIPPQDVFAGAFTLAAALPWFPPGTVFLAVVDPGVGTNRSLVAARADGHYVVGPDNGLLSLALDRATRWHAVRLTNARYWLAPLSATFHGRDILAPVAGALAAGVSWRKLGEPVARLSRLRLPELQRRGRRLIGRVLHIDAFGNLITNVPLTRVHAGQKVRYKGRAIPVVSSYAAGRPHELIAVRGSLDLLELAVRNGSAARYCRARRNDPVLVQLD